MEPTFKNFQSNGFSGETLKLCLDFLCNARNVVSYHISKTGSTSKIPLQYFDFKCTCSLAHSSTGLEDHWCGSLFSVELLSGE